MAVATRSDVELARRFLEVLGRGDWDAMRPLLADEVRLRALVPKLLREASGPDGVVERYRLWFGELGGLTLLDSGVEPAGEQVHVHYRLTGTDAEDGPVTAEQQCFVTVEDGAITKINSVCTGFQPR